MISRFFAGAVVVALPALAQPPLPGPLQFPEMIPQVVRWAEGLSQATLARGAALTPEAARMAREVGVRDISKVRIEVVDAIALPRGFELVAGRAGVRAELAGAMTLGYAILVLRGQEGEKTLLRHELRHVAQFEAAGGIAPFLAVHIPDLVRHGYEDSAYERDARAHE